MKTLRILFSTLFTLVMLLSFAVVMFLYTLDLNRYKADIEKIVYEQTGRKFSFKGDIEIAISLVPTLKIAGAVLENAKWAKHKNMVDVGDIEIEIRLLSLLDKELFIRKLTINSPKIYLETTKDGKDNWTFSEIKTKETKKTENKELSKIEVEAKTDGEKLLDDFKVDVKKLSITNGEIIFDDRVVTINSLGLSGDLIAVSLDFDGVVDRKIPVILNGDFSGVDYILKDRKNFKINTNAKVAGVSLSVLGDIYDIKNLKGLNFALNISANNLAESLRILGVDTFSKLPSLTLKTKLEGELDNIYLTNLLLNLGKNEIKGDVSYKNNDVKADIHSNLLDMTDIVMAENKDGKSKTAEVQTPTKTVDGKIFSDEKIDFSFLTANKIDAKILIDKVVLTDITDINQALLVMKNNKDGLNGSFSFKTAVSDASIQVVSDNKYENFKLDTKGEVSDIGAILKSTEKLITGGKLSFNTKVKMTGDSLAKMMATLNGDMLFKIGTATLNFTMPSIEKMLIDTVSFNKKSTDILKCFVTNLKFVNGVAVLDKRVAMESKRFNLTVDGSLDLAKEYINVGFVPVSNGITGHTTDIFSSLVRYEGDLSNPSIKIGARSITGLTSAVFGKGKQLISGITDNIVPLVDKNPCQTAENNGKPVVTKTNTVKPTTNVKTNKTVTTEQKDEVKTQTKENQTVKSTPNLKNDIKNDLKDLKKQLKGLF